MPTTTNHKVKAPTVLLIFGMHRSGTSAFAGLLKESGISMGKDLMKPAFDNPRGFYENEKIVAFNERILNILGQSWDTVSALPPNWMNIAQIQSLHKEATQFIEKEFKNISLFALKDPRFSLTFPFWQTIFQKLGINTKQYILVRHPYEVANSLYKRNQMPRATAMALWLKYMLQAVSVCQTKDSQFISFESVVNKPQGVIESLEKVVQCHLTQSEQVANSFIHQDLRHHHINQPIQEKVLAESYAILLQLTQKGNQEIAFAQLKTINQSQAVKEWIPVKEMMATLAIDYGNGFTQYAPISQEIQLDTTKLSFELPQNTEQVIIRFRLSFANQMVTLILNKIYWENVDGRQVVVDEFRVNSLVDFKQKYIFNKNGYIEFYPLPNGSQSDRLTVNLTYEKIGDWAATAIPELHQEAIDFYSNNKQIPFKTDTSLSPNGNKNSQKKDSANFWMNFLKTGMNSPVNFLKNINLDNLKTLQKALLNEPPTLILSNLKKKLLGNSATTNQWGANATANKQVEEDTLLSQMELLLKRPIKELPKQKKGGSILYFSTNLPDFDTSSGGKRATRYLSLLAQDFEVFVYSLGKQPQKYIDHLSALNIQVLSPISYEEVKAKIPFLKAIICATYPIFSLVKNLAAHYPNAQLIVDTVDVHWLREARSIGVIDGFTQEKVALNKTREIAVYEQVDSVWAVTEVDKKAILKEVPATKVAIISNVHQREISAYKDNGKQTLLFIGSYKHEPNISAVKILAQTIFPKVKASISDAELIIAGANAPKEIIELGKLSGVVFKGFVEESDLVNLYEGTFLSVSPLLAGAGIKGKICEAVAFCTPVVTTSIGNEGIDLCHEIEGLIAKPSEMAEVIIKALKRDYDFEKMTQKAAEKLDYLVGEQAVKKNLLEAFYPEISICIVTWNGLALLQKCLTALFENTYYPNYKILVYSNACTDGTIDYLKELTAENKRVIPILAPTNEVFVLPNNKMMNRFPTNEVVLLNNDTQVKANWLLELHRAAYANKSIGIAGSKILYPDGRLQEFGAILYEEGHGQNIGKGDSPNKLDYQSPKLTGYVSGCTMYIKRSTIEKIGVFDEQFHPCYYEDSDYCYTAAEHGLHTIVTPHSQVYHEEGATAGQDTNTGFKRYQAINRAKFIKKHAGKNNGIHWSNSPIIAHQL